MDAQILQAFVNNDQEKLDSISRPDILSSKILTKENIEKWKHILPLHYIFQHGSDEQADLVREYIYKVKNTRDEEVRLCKMDGYNYQRIYGHVDYYDYKYPISNVNNVFNFDDFIVLDELDDIKIMMLYHLVDDKILELNNQIEQNSRVEYSTPKDKDWNCDTYIRLLERGFNPPMNVASKIINSIPNELSNYLHLFPRELNDLNIEEGVLELLSGHDFEVEFNDSTIELYEILAIIKNENISNFLKRRVLKHTTKQNEDY